MHNVFWNKDNSAIYFFKNGNDLGLKNSLVKNQELLKDHFLFCLKKIFEFANQKNWKKNVYPFTQKYFCCMYVV